MESQKLYQEALDATQQQRTQITEDLAFSDPSQPDQWDPRVRKQREGDPGGIRPCLTFDQTQQYVANVAGQVEQRPPALHAIPVGSGADKKAAEAYDGFFRYVEHASRAQQHYARALTSAARAGVGYLIVRPAPVDRALNYLEPRISSEPDPLKVVFDPWSQELDGSDATIGWILTARSHREWDRLFPGKAKVNFGDTSGRRSKDERESVTSVEQWRVIDKKQNMVFCVDLVKGDGEVFALEEDEYWKRYQRQEVQAQPDSAGRSNFTDTYRCVKWGEYSGSEILTKETEYPASGIGIVPIYGYWGISTNGRMTYCGIPRRARDAQQAYNYHMSEIRAYMNQAPKAPWITPIRAIKGFEKLWDLAANESRANLPYHDLDDMGTIAAPTRSPIAINLTNHMAGAEQALRDIQASIGMYQASLGAPSNETSGVAIEERKQQGEASTAHFPANLAAGITQVGKLIVEMTPKIMDTKRTIRVLSIDQTPGEVVFNPDQPEAVVETDGAPISINPNVGKYDVRVVVGASFSTQRQQAQEAFTEMMRASPEMMPAIAPLWAQTIDVPNADKLAQVLTAMAPEPVKAILNPNQESSATLKAENEQLKMALQEATEVAAEAQDEITQMHAQLAEVKANHEAKAQEIQIKQRESEVNIVTKIDEMEIKRREIELKEADLALKAVQHKDGVKQTETQMAREDQAKAEEKETAALETDPEQDDQMEEALTQAVEKVVQEQVKTSKALEQQAAEQQKAIDKLLQAQEQNAALMKQLIRIAQAPREKKLQYDKNGDPIGSVETVNVSTLQ